MSDESEKFDAAIRKELGQDDTEYARLRSAYNPDERVAECPDDDAFECCAVEVSFAIPVLVTQDHQARLVKVIADITDAPWNEPKEGVHWLAEMGSKPRWSKTDAMLLGIPTDIDAPDTGEPEFDDSVFAMGTCAREFLSDKDRARAIQHREKSAREAVAACSVVLESHGWTDPIKLAGAMARVAGHEETPRDVQRFLTAGAKAITELVKRVLAAEDQLAVARL